MACRIDRKRETSPSSSAQVSAVIGPTPGTVLSRLILSASQGSRSRELTRPYSVFCNRTMVSRLSFNKGRILSWTSSWLPHTRPEIACFVQPLLVIAHPGFHPQTRNPILHLHPLAHPQLSVAQGSPSIPNLGGCHVALRQEVATQAVSDL